MTTASVQSTASRSAALDDAARAGIYRWAYRILQDHEDALDATQEVMIKWLSVGPPFVREPMAWLRRATMNHCVDVLRRRRSARRAASGPSSVDALPQVHEIALQAAAVGGTREATSDPAAVADAISRLSEMQRAVLIAKTFDGEPFARIADSLDISVSTVKTHYVRALAALRVSLAAHAAGT